MGSFVVEVDRPDAADVQALLGEHLAFARQVSPPGHVHALDVAGLLAGDLAFFSIRADGTLLGIGALRELDRRHGEVKSMHTARDARGRGVGRAMLGHLLGTARDRRYERVSLETGSMAAFAPARALYAAAGFRPCAPFGDYLPSAYSVCLTLELGAAPGQPAAARSSA